MRVPVTMSVAVRMIVMRVTLVRMPVVAVVIPVGLMHMRVPAAVVVLVLVLVLRVGMFMCHWMPDP
jgi:hypothetical protein